MKVVVELDTWQKLLRNSWAGAVDILRDIALQGREQEAIDILEEIFSPDFWGSIPTNADVNNYIQFDLADHMNLYGDSEEDY